MEYEYTKPSDKELLNQTTDEKLHLVSMGVIGVEFDPEEAELAGAFEENALSEEDALAARFDDQA